MWLLSAAIAAQIAREDDRLEVTGPALFWDRCGVAVRKGEGDLVKLLDHAVHQLKDDGTTRTLIVKWFGEGDQGIRP
jgi:ABC-type amino acid transport substrate-binding protein